MGVGVASFERLRGMYATTIEASKTVPTVKSKNMPESIRGVRSDAAGVGTGWLRLLV